MIAALIDAALTRLTAAPGGEVVAWRWRNRYPGDKELDANVVERDYWNVVSVKPRWPIQPPDGAVEVEPLGVLTGRHPEAGEREGVRNAAIEECLAEFEKPVEFRPTGWPANEPPALRERSASEVKAALRALLAEVTATGGK
jgi:hypothetical protein